MDYFYPRSPCGERRLDVTKSSRYCAYFYPRSPCGERQPATSRNNKHNVFLSTLSLRRATRLGLLGWLRTLISIHALLAESDFHRAVNIQRPTTFLSTLSLRRATREPTAFRTPHQRFLSTLSLRRATFQPLKDFSFLPIISIHALLAESDTI